MAKELYSNGKTGFLSGGLNSTATSVPLASSTMFPSTGNFMVRCDDEIMSCSANASNTLTVARGQEGTTAASHADNAPVYSVLTDGSLRRLVRQSHGGTLAGARREINFVDGGGVTWTLTDDATNDKVDVSASASAGGGFERPLVKPAMADGWAWDNQQDATVSEPGNGIAMYAVASATNGNRCLFKALPGAQYTAIMRLRPIQLSTGNFAVILKDSTGGKYQRFPFYQYSGVNRFGIDQGTNLASMNYVDYVALGMIADMFWVKIVEGSTYRTIYIGADGYTWLKMYQFSAGNYLTPSHVGFCIEPNTDRDLAVTLVGYEASTP